MRTMVGPGENEIGEVAPVSVVLDTNVFLEIHSCHDVTRIFERVHAAKTDPTKDVIDDPEVMFRIHRAREAALLAIHLDRIGATSWSLRSEPIRKLAEYVPPDSDASMELHFTTAVVHFVKDRVLGGWNPVFPTEEDLVSGDAADLALLDYAERHAVPIVTSEGVTPDGIKETKRTNMRRRGRCRNVKVYAPREYTATDTSEAIEVFLQRFYREAGEYLKTRREGDGWYRLLQWVFGFYKLILLGEVEGREERLVFAM